VRDAAIQSRLARRLRVARLALAWERLWPALWPAVGVVLGFLALALWGGFERLPGWLHLGVLLAFAVAIAGAAWRGLRPLRWPGTADAARRMERVSGVRHRPLQTISDTLRRPAGAAAAALWRQHRERALAQAARLRVGWPRASLATRDVHGIRAALALVLLAGLVAAGGDWQRRIAHAVTPDPRPTAVLAEVSAWITPPAYTSAPPIFLTPPQPGQNPSTFAPPVQAGEAIPVPAGSTLVAHVYGGRGVPVLRGDGSSSQFAVMDSQSHQTSATMRDPDSIVALV